MTRRIDYADPAVIADARRQLAEMYATADKRGRTEIGRKLGYSGKPANIRRSVRRLAQYTIKTGEQTSLNPFFRPYTTIENPDPYLGVPPHYSITGHAQISAFVMYLIRKEEGGYFYLETRSGWINTELFTEMDKGMRQFTRKVDRLYFDEEALARELKESYPGLEGIAFSGDGVNQLLARPEYDSAVPPREPLDNYGIFLYSTKHAYAKGRRLPYSPPSVTGRAFPTRPKGRREKMIRYIRLAHPRRVK